MSLTSHDILRPCPVPHLGSRAEMSPVAAFAGKQTLKGMRVGKSAQITLRARSRALNISIP